MPSLSAHLRLPEDHSRLPFHPACPVCRRDRLAGSLDGEELVSRRTQAVIAAGLLALSSVGVPAAVASEPDSTSEGTAEVVDESDPGLNPELDLGEETAQLPEEAVAPDAVAPATDEDFAPLEQEPTVDVPEPVMDASQDVAAAQPPPVPKPEPVAPAPAEPPAATTPSAETAAPSGQEESTITAQATQPRKAPKPVARPDRRPAPSITEPAPAPSMPAAEPTPAPPPTLRVVARSSGSRAAPGDRVHVVRPGESLWSIAADLLGEGATAARVAREVDRLWELNDERIRTGDPDLLFAGTRLTL